MVKKTTDYSSTIIYKITCKDELVKDVYVGHTTDFVKRKYSHKQDSINGKCKLYAVIRANGGWDNWQMENINFFNCKDLSEAKQREQEYFISLNATLNSVEPFPVREGKKIVKEDDVVITGSTYLYHCDKCKFNCVRKPDWIRHLSTSKHKKRINNDNMLTHIIPKRICSICFKEYKSNVGLWKHKKICVPKVVEQSISQIIEKKDNIIEQLIKENSDFKNIVLEIIKSNSETQKQMLELCKNKIL